MKRRKKAVGSENIENKMIGTKSRNDKKDARTEKEKEKASRILALFILSCPLCLFLAFLFYVAVSHQHTFRLPHNQPTNQHSLHHYQAPHALFTTPKPPTPPSSQPPPPPAVHFPSTPLGPTLCLSSTAARLQTLPFLVS